MSSGVPAGWGVKLLSDTLSQVVSGQSPNRKDHPAKAGQYGILKTTAIGWGKYSPSKNQEVLDDFKVNLKHQVKVGDILITKAGPVHRVGVVAYVPATPERMLVSGKMTLLRTNSDHDARYISYALSSEFTQKPLKESTTGMAASQTNFTHDTLLSIPVRLPSALPEQQKIAAILSTVDDVIEKTRAQIDKLKDLKTGMMQELLTKGIGHTEFKDSPVGRIPVGWGFVELRDLIGTMDGGVSVNSENRLKKVGEIGVLKVSCVFKGRFLPNEHKVVVKEDLDRVRVKPIGDHILFSRANTPELVGESGYVEKSFSDLYLPDKIWMINVEDRENTHIRWLSYILSSGRVRKLISDVATGTSGSMKNISKPSLLSITVPLPSFDEQKKIASVIQSIDENLYISTDKLIHVESAKKALMQDLLTGKVRVKIDDKESAVA
jgi:type I restriction enzyme S subunit